MAEANEPLTERELEVVRLLATGVSNKELAALIHVSPNTVRVHLRNIFTKLGAQSRTEVTMVAVRNGWVDAGRVVTEQPETAPADGVVVANEANSAVDLTNTAPTLTPSTEAAQLPVPVPVAPNPQPVPPLPFWRRAALLIGLVLALVLAVLALPRPAAESFANNGDALLQDTSSAPVAELSPSETTRWYARASVRTARARAAVAAANGRVYVIGGEVDRQPSAEVLAYDPKTDAWQDFARKPTAVMNAGAAVIGNKIYVPGGTTSGEIASNTFEVYDVVSNTWTALAPLPRKLAGHAVTTFGNEVYAVGGRTTTGMSADVFAFDTRTGRWSILPSLPTPRSQLAAVTANGRIFVVGGFDGQRELATCEYFQISERKWHSCGSMTIPRGGLGLAQVGSTLYAIGGGLTGFIGFNERYDAAADKWVPFEMPPSRLGDWRNAGVASLPTEFYVVGGSTRGTIMADTYVFEVMNNRTFLPAFQGTGK